VALLGHRAVVRVAPVRRDTLRVAVSCAGILQPPAGGELRARDAASVGRIVAQDGTPVRRGAVILELSDPELVARERQAREEVLQLAAEAAAAAEEAARARKEAEHRREVLAADRRLLDQAAIPRAAYEASELALREAEARRVSAEATAAPARLALARARASDLAARVAALVLRAPADGVVYGLPRREGERVAAGQVVASITDPDHPEVRVKVDQPDLPRVSEGQRIVVTFDGLPERRFEGTLRAVSRGLRESGGREVAEVLGAIEDPDRLLPWNASVNVEVVVLERSGALLAPRAALQRDGERRYVYVAQDGRAVRRDVSVGAVSTSDAQIEKGLSEGEAVILPGSTSLVDGVAVTLAKP
jgi:macrolide-specific efflux system membrane fusion protein